MKNSIRLFFWVLGFLGVVLYLALVSVFSMEVEENPGNHSFWQQLNFFLSFVIFGSGLPPLILALYFFFFRKEIRELFLGLGFVILSIFIHFFVVAGIAHAPFAVYVLMMLAESFFVAVVIYKWEKLKKRNGDVALT